MNIDKNFKIWEQLEKIPVDYLISAPKHHWCTLYVAIS